MAVDEDEMKNLKMKRTQKIDHCENCNAMQSTKKGQKKCCKWLRGKETNHSTKNNVTHRLQQIPKGKNRPRGNDSKFKNAYQGKVLSKTPITLQHLCIVI